MAIRGICLRATLPRRKLRLSLRLRSKRPPRLPWPNMLPLLRRRRLRRRRSSARLASRSPAGQMFRRARLCLAGRGQERSRPFCRTVHAPSVLPSAAGSRSRRPPLPGASSALRERTPSSKTTPYLRAPSPLQWGCSTTRPTDRGCRPPAIGAPRSSSTLAGSCRTIARLQQLPPPQGLQQPARQLQLRVCRHLISTIGQLGVCLLLAVSGTIQTSLRWPRPSEPRPRPSWTPSRLLPGELSITGTYRKQPVQQLVMRQTRKQHAWLRCSTPWQDKAMHVCRPQAWCRR
mmetsp:Transcript_90758/g.163845  ORF Transcript_90758/g.163845 Transcript_90758/m.163845 type:complete len:289 (+) Transcript_90758:1535-2401(+)